MKRYKLELITMGDIKEFVNAVTPLPGEIRLADDNGLCVNAKSMLGAVATIEWNALYCYSEYEIGEYISKFCVDEKPPETNQISMFEGGVFPW